MNDKWRYHATRITKYNRTAIGYNPDAEWTSYSDIGKFFHGEILTEKAYLQVEQAHVQAIKLVIDFTKDTNFVVKAIEKSDHNWLFERNLTISQIELFCLLQKGDIISTQQLLEAIPIILRECMWAAFSTQESNLQIQFGYDYYMYVAYVDLPESVIQEIEKLGLFVD